MQTESVQGGCVVPGTELVQLKAPGLILRVSPTLSHTDVPNMILRYSDIVPFLLLFMDLYRTYFLIKHISYAKKKRKRKIYTKSFAWQRQFDKITRFCKAEVLRVGPPKQQYQ